MTKILIADDNQPSRELLRAVLKRCCDQVIEACNGQEALDKITDAMPDLVLLDLEMPLLDGIAVLHRLRRDPRFVALPVMAVTANAMRGMREKVLAQGFDGYVSKPIEAAALRDQVTAILGRHLA